MKPHISLFWSQIDVDKPNTVYIQALYNKKVAAQLRLSVDGKAGWIGALYVQPEYRNKGLGNLLLYRAFAICRAYGFQSVGLTVHDDNKQAQELYKKHGFIPYREGYEHYQEYVKQLR